MPPVPNLQSQLEGQIASETIVIYSKTTCPFCDQVKDIFKSLKKEYVAVELDLEENGVEIQTTLLNITGQRTVPNVFVNGKHLGGCSDVKDLHARNNLLPLFGSAHSYEYDLIVVGGGSGGLAAAKEAAAHGKKVACLDFVQPSPKGSSWGLGGTCVNVGCIPKKLMHQAALLGSYAKDSEHFGWKPTDDSGHDWNKMVDNIQSHIGSLNWGYRVALRSANVVYVNAYAKFKDAHTLTCTTKKGKVTEMTAQNIIVATGGRPTYPDIPGAKEFGYTSDDVFSLRHAPKKTLMVGASYVSLECAGFLRGLGYDVSVMVRSILLRGFDQQIAEKIGEYMEKEGVKFIRPCVPTKITKVEDGSPGKYEVEGKYNDGTPFKDTFNTVIFAVGRYPCTDIGLKEIGVELNKSGFVKCGKMEVEQTNVPNVYAVGDILEGKMELTPLAIHAGRALAKRLFANSKLQTNYDVVPTTVFTPLEYGAIGMAEEDAISKFGEKDIEVYHSALFPLEWTVAKRSENDCYVKLVCVKSKNEKVVGFHYLGPNAGEVTQGYALGMSLGACKKDFDATIGIHPTCAELMNSLFTTKASGKDVKAAGC